MKQSPVAAERWMKRALELAQRGEGRTRPNPPVGAVIVKKGRVVGEGYHRRAGGPHAEVYALRQAGKKARGATLFVTLEPCSTWGRTPPCTEAILRAGVREVVAAVSDPNPCHAGRGLRWLRKHGILVRTGVGREQARELLRPFAKWIRTGTPWVTLKLAATMDGRIADQYGSSKWITGTAARRRVHEIRARVDAIMVGANTIAADDPQLLPRPDRGRKPFRVVVDSLGAHVPLKARVFTDDAANRTILAVPRGYSPIRLRTLRARGVRVLELENRRGGISLSHLMRELGRMGLLHVLCEGGGKLSATLVEERCVDSYLFFYSPKLLGDNESYPMLRGHGWRLNQSPELTIIRCERVGQDILLEARPRGKR